MKLSSISEIKTTKKREKRHSLQKSALSPGSEIRCKIEIIACWASGPFYEKVKTITAKRIELWEIREQVETEKLRQSNQSVLNFGKLKRRSRHKSRQNALKLRN